jgi:1-acyl-sn-glycerol-3-phosphate acyltransferase
MLYSILHFIFRLAFKVLFRWEIYGRENIPPSGGAILAANHTSFLDPILVGTSLDRKIYFFARSSLFHPRPWSWLLKKLHTVPVERNKPAPSSIKRVLRLLKSGRLILMFPEGTRGSGETLSKARGGVGMMAAKSGLPVIPVYISGAARILPKGARMIRPRKVKIIYGAAMRFVPDAGRARTKEEFHRIGNQVLGEIAALRNQLESV